jgi:hypothetical protein
MLIEALRRKQCCVALRRSAVAALCFALVGACSPDSAVAPEEGLTVLKVAGDRQVGLAGRQLSRALHIQVLRSTSRLGASAPITTEVTGGGSVNTGIGQTASDGRAFLRWRLGDSDGENQLTVTVAGAEPLTFTATAVAVAPENIYYHWEAPADEVPLIGLTTDGRFVSVEPGGCSSGGEYTIDGSEISFVVGTSDGCSGLPSLTASIDEAAIVFLVEHYDNDSNPFEVRLVYRKTAP